MTEQRHINDRYGERLSPPPIFLKIPFSGDQVTPCGALLRANVIRVGHKIDSCAIDRWGNFDRTHPSVITAFHQIIELCLLTLLPSPRPVTYTDEEHRLRYINEATRYADTWLPSQLQFYRGEARDGVGRNRDICSRIIDFQENTVPRLAEMPHIMRESGNNEPIRFRQVKRLIAEAQSRQSGGVRDIECLFPVD